VWSMAETVRQSTAEDAGNGLGEESIVEEALRKLRMEFCSALRRRETEHAERPRRIRVGEKRFMRQK